MSSEESKTEEFPLTSIEEDVETLEKKEEVFLEFLRLTDEYLQLRQKLHENLKRGHIALASAQFSRRSPGKLKPNINIFNREMTASFRVESKLQSEEKENKSQEINEHFVKCEILERESNSLLGNRKTIEKGREDGKDKEKDDPLRWFGLLTPRHTKKAQKNFINSLDLILEIANIQKKLESVEKEWIELL